MCQMCEEYEAELRRMGIVEKPADDGETPRPLHEDAQRPLLDGLDQAGDTVIGRRDRPRDWHSRLAR